MVESLVNHVSEDEFKDTKDLQAILDSLLPDLQSFLTTPPKSEQKRAQLLTKKIKKDDQEYAVSDEFVNAACAVSTDLNLDELVAAELVLNSDDDVQRLGVSPAQGAIAMFYLRRQYILQLVKYFVGCLGQTSSNFAKIGTSIIQNDPDAFTTKILESFKSVEEGLAEVDEKEKQGHFLDLMTDEFTQTLKMRKDFLYMEHGLLGEILNNLAASSKVSINGFKKVMDFAQGLTNYNNLTLHCIPFFLTFCRAVEHRDNSHDAKMSLAQKLYDLVVKSHDREANNDNTSAWKLPYFRAVVEIVVLAVYTSACREAPHVPDVDFRSQIIGPALDSVDDGCFEFFMALAADTMDQKDVHPKYYDYRPILQTRIPSFDLKCRPSAQFRSTLIQGLEYTVDTIICNLADVLKQIRVSEEDTVLSLHHESQSFGDESDDEERFQLPNVQLETFCAFVSYLYAGRPDALKFWLDTDSHLYGFVDWAAHSHVTFMTSAFCDMLASLVCDEQSASDAHRFLSQEAALGRARISTRLSWDRIMGSLTEYSERLEMAKKGALGLNNVNASANGRSAISHTAPSSVQTPSSTVSKNVKASTLSSRVAKNCLSTKTQIDPDHELFSEDESLLISTYLRLIASVVRHDAEARSRFLSLETPDLLVALFRFLCLPGSSLCGPSLDALAAFASTSVKSERHGLWRSLDLWIEYMDPMMRLDHIFSNPSDVLGFVTLAEALMRPLLKSDHASSSVQAYLFDAQNLQNLPYPLDLGTGYRTPGLVPYCQFILGNVFRNSNVFDKQDCHMLQTPCLLFALSSLELIDPQWFTLAAAARLPLPIDGDIHHFAVLHSFAAAMSTLFNSKVYNVLFDIILADENSETAVLALRLLLDILERQDVFMELAVVRGKDQQQRQPQQSQAQNSGQLHQPVNAENSALMGPSPAAPILPSFVMYGFTRFDDALMFRLPIVTQLAINVGSANVELSYWSCVLLSKISEMPQFSQKAATGRSRLLSAVEAVSDSHRVRDAFMEQLERQVPEYVGSFTPKDDLCVPEHYELGFYVKYRSLEFLAEGLRRYPNEACYAHYILGFEITDEEMLASDSSRGGIETPFSVLASLRDFLEASIQESTKSFMAARNARVAGEIIYLLSQSPLTSVLTLDFLRANNHTLQMLEIEPDLILEIPASTEWQTELLDRRALFLENLSMEMHHCATYEATSLLEKYAHRLLGMSSATRSVPMLDFLNILNRPISVKSAIEPDSTFASLINVDDLLRVTDHNIPSIGRVIAMILAQSIKSVARPSALQAPSSTALTVSSEPAKNPLVQSAIATFDCICDSQKLRRERDSQLRCAAAWAKLVLVVVYDSSAPDTKKSALISEILQRLVPRLSDAAADDVGFAEVYASLTVQLVRVCSTKYQGVRSAIVDALFRTCVIAVQVPESTAQLRADLYLICNYILSEPLLGVLKALGGRFLEIVCTDALTGQGLSRGSALLFLENACTFSAKTQSTFLLEQLNKHNLLSLLVRSLRSSSTTVFTYQTLALLLQIAQIPGGAPALIQCNLLNILDDSSLLRGDLDVDPEKSYQRMLVAVLRLVVSILVAMGPGNLASVARIQTFVNTHGTLMQSILKKDNMGGADQDLVQLVVTLTELVRS